jgi:hypothetical protein
LRSLRRRVLSWHWCWIAERLLRFVRRIAGGIVHRFVRRILEGRNYRIVRRRGMLRSAGPDRFLRHGCVPYYKRHAMPSASYSPKMKHGNRDV